MVKYYSDIEGPVKEEFEKYSTKHVVTKFNSELISKEIKFLIDQMKNFCS
jgi:hypothetical protein